MSARTRISPQRRRRDFRLKKVPRQARARATVDAVVEAAARILATQGHAALTVERLVTVSGVSVGSIYEYFPDKQTIVAEVVRRLLAEISSELAEGAAAAARSTPEVALRAWVRVMFDVVKKRRGLVRVLSHEVSFLGEIDEVRRFPLVLLELVRGSPPTLKDLPYVTEASMFLLTVMVRSAVLEAVIDRPGHLEAADVEETLVQMLFALLAHGLAAVRRARR